MVGPLTGVRRRPGHLSADGHFRSCRPIGEEHDASGTGSARVDARRGTLNAQETQLRWGTASTGPEPASFKRSSPRSLDSRTPHLRRGPPPNLIIDP